jgi:hypothetical protein
MKRLEYPGSTREPARSNTGYQTQRAMAKRNAVASPERADLHVGIQQPGDRILCVADRRASRDLIEVRGRDRADVTGAARVRRAFFPDMELSAAL